MALQKVKVLGDQTNKISVEIQDKWEACRVSGLNG